MGANLEIISENGGKFRNNFLLYAAIANGRNMAIGKLMVISTAEAT